VSKCVMGLIGKGESGQTRSRHEVSETRENVSLKISREVMSWEKLTYLGR